VASSHACPEVHPRVTSLNSRKEALLLERDPSFRSRWREYFESTRAAASATEELYRFAADRSRQVHVENETLVIADPDGYNKRMNAVSDAMGKLRSATAAPGESGSKTKEKE
jgi:hypothetical protein